MRTPLSSSPASPHSQRSDCGSIEPTAPTTVSPGGVPSRSNNGGTPAPAPTPTPTPTPPSSGSGAGAVQVTVSPNPVPFSGQPITDIATCATRPNTWFYNRDPQGDGRRGGHRHQACRHVRRRRGDRNQSKPAHRRKWIHDHSHPVVQRVGGRPHGSVELQRYGCERKDVERHRSTGPAEREVVDGGLPPNDAILRQYNCRCD